MAHGGHTWAVRIRVAAAALGVALVVGWVHRPVLECEALFFDDNQYLTTNGLVSNPSWASAVQFLREVLEPTTVKGYYQPLTMISLMADYARGGRSDHLRPFHRTGLLLHVINSVLVLVLLFQLTGSAGVGFAAALLFGLHPVATEVVPWIAQRKTLLATFFSLGSLIAYVSWVHCREYWRLAVSLMLYVLALLSKPTALPLLAVFVLLDWWPLDRFNKKSLLEKIPFAVIAAVFAVVTVVSQARSGGTVSSIEESMWRPLLIVGYAPTFYLRQLLWPVGWPGYYVFPEPFSLAHPAVLAYVSCTILLTIAVVISLRYTRAVMSGAMMYFALLFPTLGVIGFTDVVAANRFLYLPMIVLLIPLGVLGARAVESGRPTSRARFVWIVVGLSALGGVCLGEAMITRQAMMPWRDTVRLYVHLAQAAPNAPKVRFNYGNALSDVGRLTEAVVEYEAALALKPEYDHAHNNLAVTLDALGRNEQADDHFERAILLNPNSARARNSYGAVLLRRGSVDRAIALLQEARRIDPDLTEAAFNLGVAMMDKGAWSEAAAAFEAVIQAQPQDAMALARLGYAYERLDRLEEARAAYERALSIDPAQQIAAERLRLLEKSASP